MNLKPIDVSYRQVAVFQAALPNPFNNWTDGHVAQGFAWRPGSVSFATLEESGVIDAEVARAAPTGTDLSATRSIAVPFEVDESGAVEVASIGDGVALKLPPGPYRLTFEHGVAPGGRMWCRLWFEATPGVVAEAIVVKADESLHPGAPLLMEAEPA